MTKEINVSVSFKFNRDLLDIEASASFSGLPVFDDLAARSTGYARVFRMFPLTELEVRSLRFTKASPVEWIENHVLDLIRLQAFYQGFDARPEQATFHINYMDSWAQREYSIAGDGEATVVEDHLYRWFHDRTNSELVLTDNRQEIVRTKVRGPQSYTQLAVWEEEARKQAVQENLTAENAEREVERGV